MLSRLTRGEQNQQEHRAQSGALKLHGWLLTHRPAVLLPADLLPTLSEWQPAAGETHGRENRKQTERAERGGPNSCHHLHSAREMDMEAGYGNNPRTRIWYQGGLKKSAPTLTNYPQKILQSSAPTFKKAKLTWRHFLFRIASDKWLGAELGLTRFASHHLWAPASTYFQTDWYSGWC